MAIDECPSIWKTIFGWTPFVSSSVAPVCLRSPSLMFVSAHFFRSAPRRRSTGAGRWARRRLLSDGPALPAPLGHWWRAQHVGNMYRDSSCRTTRVPGKRESLLAGLSATLPMLERDLKRRDLPGTEPGPEFQTRRCFDLRRPTPKLLGTTPQSARGLRCRT